MIETAKQRVLLVALLAESKIISSDNGRPWLVCPSISLWGGRKSHLILSRPKGTNSDKSYAGSGVEFFGK